MIHKLKSLPAVTLSRLKTTDLGGSFPSGRARGFLLQTGFADAENTSCHLPKHSCFLQVNLSAAGQNIRIAAINVKGGLL
ncbi:hypothetical protein [Dysgonomonas sp.]